MTRPIRYGIIGCGMMGQEHLRNIALLDGASVAAIFEPNADMRARASTIAPEARIAPSLDALLETTELDCLVIASPNFCHASQIMHIAQTRPLPLLVEKPLVSAVTHDAQTVVYKLFPVPKGPSFLAELFTELSGKGVVVDIITQSESEEGQRLAFSINQEDQKITLDVLKEKFVLHLHLTMLIVESKRRSVFHSIFVF